MWVVARELRLTGTAARTGMGSEMRSGLLQRLFQNLSHGCEQIG
jgi:hypothetical protein